MNPKPRSMLVALVLSLVATLAVADAFPVPPPPQAAAMSKVLKPTYDVFSPSEQSQAAIANSLTLYLHRLAGPNLGMKEVSTIHRPHPQREYRMGSFSLVQSKSVYHRARDKI